MDNPLMTTTHHAISQYIHYVGIVEKKQGIQHFDEITKKLINLVKIQKISLSISSIIESNLEKWRNVDGG
jgi:uncharacterized membrane protein